MSKEEGGFIPNISDYPKWKYHAEYPAMIVSSAEDEDGLGDGWFDTPWEPKGEDQDGNKVEGEQVVRRGRKPKVQE